VVWAAATAARPLADSSSGKLGNTNHSPTQSIKIVLLLVLLANEFVCVTAALK
jgi:hypothetical protein